MNKAMTCCGMIGLAIGFAVLSGACQPSSDTGTGTLRVLVTDKPFPFEFIKEANITITRVEVRTEEAFGGCGGVESCDDGDLCTVDTCDPDTLECVHDLLECDEGFVCNGVACVPACTEDSECDDEVECTEDTCVMGLCVNTPIDCDDDDDTDDEDDGVFLVIFEGEQEFNLLDLQNGRTDLLADADIPAGTYTQMRLIVSEGEVVLNDEEISTFPLSVPSGSQTGIKLHFEFTVEDGEETTLLLDIDVSKAFQPIPGGHIDDPNTIREFKFKPSIAMRLINIVDAGSISGTVTDTEGTLLGNVAVTIYSGDEEITSTSTNAEDGTYTVTGLTTGEYRVEFSANGYEDFVVDAVSVTAGETTEGIDAEMTPVT